MNMTVASQRVGAQRVGAQRVVALNDLAGLVSQRVGVSRWHAVTQEQIDLFAEATGDHQWIHVDPDRARTGPFGTTIAHGYLTLSLAPMLLWDVLEVTEASRVVNYGIGKVRFPAPIPVGSRVRMAVDLAAIEETSDWVQPTWRLTIQVEGVAKPACVAEILMRYYS
jgi:acyl dehydratase